MPSTLGFPKKLIVATGTSVLANPNLEGLETVETTRPRKQSGHLPSPLLLARSLLAPFISTATNDSNGEKASIYKPKGGPKRLGTPTPRGSPRKVTTKARCLRKGKEV